MILQSEQSNWSTLPKMHIKYACTVSIHFWLMMDLTRDEFSKYEEISTSEGLFASKGLVTSGDCWQMRD